ncbi:MAG: hypothetical protein MK207_15990 [Saprospiraceae bacterium]|nr:hypothetical protein [Saprospiraceae bacterium]
MRQILLVLLFLTPLILIAQNSQSEELMNELGYEKVDLTILNKKQINNNPCSGCTSKQINNNRKTNSIPSEEELKKLHKLVPKLKHQINLLTKNKNTAPAILQKYRTALKNTLKSIERLEKHHVNN